MSMKYISPSDFEPLPTNWVLQTLKRNSSPTPTSSHPRSTFQHHATESDGTQELPHIGYISIRYGAVIYLLQCILKHLSIFNRWVGQHGKANLMNAARIETNHTIIQKAKKALLHLAKSCL